MPKVNLGRTLATRGLLMALQGAHETHDQNAILFPYFVRHSEGDWGDLDEHDRQVNEDAIVAKGRVMSVYRSEMGVVFWIITDQDWELTTALLPEDY